MCTYLELALTANQMLRSVIQLEIHNHDYWEWSPVVGGYSSALVKEREMHTFRGILGDELSMEEPPRFPRPLLKQRLKK